MAHVHQLPSGKYRVLIRRKGLPAMSRTFATERLAVEWAARMDREITDGVLQQKLESIRQDALTPPLRDALEHYINTPAIKAKKSIRSIRAKANMIGSHEIADMKISAIRPPAIVKYRDDRLQVVQSGTVSNELSLLSRVFAHYVERGVLEMNPCTIRRPPSAAGRDRRLEGDEGARLLEAARNYHNPEVADILCMSLETGMRIREILGLEWKNVDLDQGTAHLPDTKNGTPRDVPLSDDALDVLIKRNDGRKSARVFSMSYDGFRYCWKVVTKQAEIDYHDLRIHDLRHELASRLFERDGLDVMEAATVTGHKDLRMLKRYTHLKAADIRKKLNRKAAKESPVSSSIAKDRLHQLKALFEDGLISAEVYVEKQHALLAEFDL